MSYVRNRLKNKMQDGARELNYLSSIINQLLVGGSESKHVFVSNTILNLMLKEYDLSPLADQIIKLLALPYPSLKRIVCCYLKKYASSASNLCFLSTNCLLKDFEDPNPYIRALVIKTACQIPCLHELAYQLLPLALCDNSSYVRCAAATSSTFIIHEQNLESLQNIIDKLYNMIRDPDPSVTSASLDALDVILHYEGGVVINSRLSRYLVGRLEEFHDWHFATVSKVLKKYVPKDVNELVLYLNAFDTNLSSSNVLLSILATEIVLYYIFALDHNISSDVIEQVSPFLNFLLHHSSDELIHEILVVMKKLMIPNKQHFVSFYKHCFCCFSESVFVKIKKLELIVDFGAKPRLPEISDELLLHCYNHVKEIACQSISCFIKLFLSNIVDIETMRSFASITDIQYNNLNEELLVSLCSSKALDNESFRSIFIAAISKKSSKITSVLGKLAMLKLIANYGKYIEDAPYLVEDIMNDPQNLENENIVTMLITASVQLFLLRPAEMQLLIGRILQFASHSDNIILKKQSSIFYHLITEKNREKLLIPL